MKKVIKLVGDVGGYDNSYNRILDGVWLESELAGLTSEDEIEFIIHSFGGSVFEGQYMYNLLKKCPAQKVAHIYGSCMSMATILSMACDKVYMCENSMYMVHKASIGAYGNEKEFESVLSALKGVDSIAINTYSKRTKLTKEKLISDFMTGYDKWLTPTEALEFGFIDEIKDPIQEVIQSDNYSNYDFGFDVYFQNAKDAEMKERPLILNSFTNKTHTKMEAEKKDLKNPKVEIPLNDSDPLKIISQLQNESNNWKKEVLDKNTVISSLEIERDTVKAQLETIQNEAFEKIAKFEKEANEAKELLNAKDIQLQKEKIENAVKLAVSDMRVTYPLLSASDGEKLATDFINRHSITLTNEVVTVIDKITQGISDNIPSAVTHFAITTNYVQATKTGFGKSVSANLSSSEISNSYQKQQEEQEINQILNYRKELQKQGVAASSEKWCKLMLAKFPNSEKAVPTVLKEKFNLK